MSRVLRLRLHCGAVVEKGAAFDESLVIVEAVVEHLAGMTRPAICLKETGVAMMFNLAPAEVV